MSVDPQELERLDRVDAAVDVLDEGVIVGLLDKVDLDEMGALGGDGTEAGDNGASCASTTEKIKNLVWTTSWTCCRRANAAQRVKQKVRYRISNIDLVTFVSEGAVRIALGARRRQQVDREAGHGWGVDDHCVNVDGYGGMSAQSGCEGGEDLASAAATPQAPPSERSPLELGAGEMLRVEIHDISATIPGFSGVFSSLLFHTQWRG